MAKTNPIEKYLEANLFTELGLHTLSLEEREQFLNSFLEVIFRRIGNRLVKELNETQRTELNDFLTKHPEDHQAAFDYLRGTVTNFEDLLKEEVAGYKGELLRLAGKTK